MGAGLTGRLSFAGWPAFALDGGDQAVVEGVPGDDRRWWPLVPGLWQDPRPYGHLGAGYFGDLVNLGLIVPVGGVHVGDKAGHALMAVVHAQSRPDQREADDVGVHEQERVLGPAVPHRRMEREDRPHQRASAR